MEKVAKKSAVNLCKLSTSAQFACHRITAQRWKFDHVVASLTPEVAAEMRDLLLKPPTDNA